MAPRKQWLGPYMTEKLLTSKFIDSQEVVDILNSMHLEVLKGSRCKQPEGFKWGKKHTIGAK